MTSDIRIKLQESHDWRTSDICNHLLIQKTPTLAPIASYNAPAHVRECIYTICGFPCVVLSHRPDFGNRLLRGQVWLPL